MFVPASKFEVLHLDTTANMRGKVHEEDRYDCVAEKRKIRTQFLCAEGLLYAEGGREEEVPGGGQFSWRYELDKTSMAILEYNC